MPSFKGNDSIHIRSSTLADSRTFNAATKTADTDKKGYLPVGVTISDAVVTATKKQGGADATSALIVSQTFGASSVSVVFKDPTALGEGAYNLKMVLTLSNGDVLGEDFGRVYAKTI
jgi:hypothetical protein